jgi:ribokinase
LLLITGADGHRGRNEEDYPPWTDTTGAGDAFSGALAACLTAGDCLRAAASHATRVGAYAVRRRGAQPSYPSPAEELP